MNDEFDNLVIVDAPPVVKPAPAARPGSWLLTGKGAINLAHVSDVAFDRDDAGEYAHLRYAGSWQQGLCDSVRLRGDDLLKLKFWLERNGV